MDHRTHRITRIDVKPFTIPTETAYEADGTLAWTKTTVVVVEAHAAGQVGIGYSYAHKAAAELIHQSLAQEVVGIDALDIPAAFEAMIRKVRNTGRPGIASYAIAAVDIALWDLKAKILDVSLAKLLGQYRSSIPVYGSGGFTSYPIQRLQEQLASWVEEGIPRVKMKIGSDAHDFDFKTTLERIRAARLAIGIEPELFVDANGAYQPKQALALAKRLEEYSVIWFEEPVSSDDLEGLAFVRENAPDKIEIASGEYGNDVLYFERMVPSLDVVQIDATRCLGVTGFLAASRLCGAKNRPVSGHTAPQIHAHLCCAIPEARHLEYFFDHVRVDSLLFEGALRQKGGYLTPDPERPGLGIELKLKDARKFAA